MHRNRATYESNLPSREVLALQQNLLHTACRSIIDPHCGWFSHSNQPTQSLYGGLFGFAGSMMELVVGGQCHCISAFAAATATQ